MKRIKHTEKQTIRVLKRFEAGEKAADLTREAGITLPTFYNWKAKFSVMEVFGQKLRREGLNCCMALRGHEFRRAWPEI